ncbi:MAG: flagellar motor protein MotB [Planctomycetota bacterium]|jgi:chemotaxis protein MotB
MADENVKKPAEEEEDSGAPEWMVSFCDCMTLLLTFFVLLLSFASFDKETLPIIGQSFARALPTIGLSSKNKQDSMFKRQESNDKNKQVDGTETRTDSTSQTSNFMKEKKPLDFRNLKVFTVESESFFWGNASAISQEGRDILDALAEFLNHQKGRIVISENGPEPNAQTGLPRCMAIMNYLTHNHNIKKDRFNLTAATTMKTPPTERMVEITLLDRSVYE